MAYQNRKHWVFDLDGTLIDTFPFYLKIVHQLLGDHGITLSPHETISCLGQNAKSFFEAKLGPARALGSLQKLREQSLIDIQFIRPFTGIAEILTHLKNRDKRLAIWTSRDLESAELVLKYTGLDIFADHIVSGCCVTKHKPEPEGLQNIATHFDCRAADLIMVGDHDVDMMAAKQVGAFGIRAAWHDLQPPSKCTFADEIFQSVAEFKKAVVEPVSKAT